MFHSEIFNSQLVGVNDIVGQHAFHVIPCFLIRNQFDPDIGGHVVFRQPAFDAVWTGIIGGNGQYRVFIKLLIDLFQVSGSQSDIFFRVKQVLPAWIAHFEFTGN